MARTTVNELKRRRLADASAGERTEFDETYATTALTIRVGEQIRYAAARHHHRASPHEKKMPTQRVSKARGRRQRDPLIAFLDEAEQTCGPVDGSVMQQVRR